MTAIDNLLRDLMSAKEKWIGCDWPTQYGARKLDLRGLRSRQAMIAAKATRGEESECWQEAAAWLHCVELDAATAAELGQHALDAVRRGQFDLALSELDQAIAVQQKYPLPPRYAELRAAVEKFRD